MIGPGGAFKDLQKTAVDSQQKMAKCSSEFPRQGGEVGWGGGVGGRTGHQWGSNDTVPHDSNRSGLEPRGTF